jgi:hypothetical protein
MSLPVIPRETLPIGLVNQLMTNEQVFYFSYISYKGGCFSSSTKDEHWISLTDKRVLYKARVADASKTVEKEGTLPIEKVSFIEVTEVDDKSGCYGCSSTKYSAISISTSGGAVVIPVPTKEKANEIRMVYQSLVEELKIQ